MKTPAIIISVIIVAVVIGLAFGLYVFFKKRAENSSKRPEFTADQYETYNKAKEVALEHLLGPMHNTVGHAIVPFYLGGAVDMYYFPKALPGTAFATMELIEPDGTGPLPNKLGIYEFVTFTRLNIPASNVASDKNLPFNLIERRMCGIMTMLGRYSHEAVLNPGDTCELPGDKGEPGMCLIFDEYTKDGEGLVIAGKRHCLLLCIEVFPSEMQYAMKHGHAPVIQKLKDSGCYPYSDLDRKPVL